jgi:cytoskeletal protein CcmA (bactofilin family)
MLTADQDLAFESLEIGGMGSVRGNGKGRSIEVGGKFEVRGSLDLEGELEVGGAVSVGEALTGRSLSVGGSLDARRAVFSGDAEVGGSISTREGAKADRFRLRHRSRATGPLVGNVVEIESKGRAEDVYGRRVELGRKAEARRIVAATVRLDEGCEVGEILYAESIELGRGVRCRQPPRKVDVLPPFPL